MITGNAGNYKVVPLRQVSGGGLSWVSDPTDEGYNGLLTLTPLQVSFRN